MKNKLTLLLGLALIPTILTSCAEGKTGENEVKANDNLNEVIKEDKKVEKKEETKERLVAPVLEINGNSFHQYTYLVKNTNDVAVTYYSQNLEDGLHYEIPANDYVLIDGSWKTDDESEFIIIAGYFEAYNEKGSYVSRLTIKKCE